MKYYLEEFEDVLKEKESVDTGLTEDEAKTRLEKYGENKLVEKEKESLLKKFLKEI